MSENTPERLKAFRAAYDGPRRPSRGWATVNLIVLLAGFAGVSALVVWKDSRPESAAAVTPGSEARRALAVYLADKNQIDAAMTAYDAYIAEARLEGAERGKVRYTMADLAIDRESYETALTYLYEAEMLLEGTDLKAEIDKKILLCLDKLGRSESLRRELKQRSSVTRTAAQVPSGEIVIAEFGDEVITDKDLDREIEKLAASVRESFDTPEKKAEFLKNLIAERLLVDKARRQGLEENAEIQEIAAKQLDALIVRKLIDDEVRTKISVTPEDIERFYKAEIDRFTEPAKAEGRIGRGADETAAKTDAARPEAPKARVARDRISGGDVPEEPAKALAAAVLGAEPGAAIHAVQAGDTWYAFDGTLTAAKVTPFETAKEQASRQYQAQKEQEQVSALIEDTLRARNVTLHMDRLKKDEEAAP